ncbi:5-oxoprolinase subunit C family protein [Sphingobacterium bambusae]|uniref:Biotin-dependent carboxyltransferase family protein n=1 Tax=Sphingobacterium bambusae TaxID=662858 RepID=A0ABW6BEY1_9SPHI|nr:biotin-dependent carboxyltransferase family protein [Sphingobacterium bambusae]WPL48671.1 biotin-dependent carboxyltransferase family protein [Sphingobacterium bambusae]
MGIKVIQAGLLTTVQDLGRFGLQRYGMVVSGAMDGLALRLGNMLLGNDENEAALECTMVGPRLLFEERRRIVLTGGDLSAALDGVAVPMWKPISVHAGSILSFGKAVHGCRCYICFDRGLAIETLMGSKSTYLRAKIGGWKGRALQKGDRIPFQYVDEKESTDLRWRLGHIGYPDLSQRSIRVIEGPHYAQFDQRSREDFLNISFLISNESDRMGYRLASAALRLTLPIELLSSAVTFGTIQVPPQGQPIVLMADHPTTGGYPIIGQVIEADLPLLAQLQPQDSIRFERVTVADAQQIVKDRHQQIQELKISIALKYEK